MSIRDLTRRDLNTTFAKAALAFSVVCLGAGAAIGQVALTKFSAPIPVTADSKPYHGENPVAHETGIKMAPGYIEREYMISGSVNGTPYATTVLVRRPSDPKKFSGVLIVEPLHAAGVVPVWGTYESMIMEGGHAWASVAVQRQSAEGLMKRSNPTRYASVNVPQVNMTPDIGQQIMTQFGAAVRAKAPGSPFADLNVKYAILGGTSQTGGWTLNYIKQGNAAARQPNGKPIWDALYPTQAPVSGTMSGNGSIIMHVYAEADFGLGGGAARRTFQPDSDAPGERIRTVEITGGSHMMSRGMHDASGFGPGLGPKPDGELSQYPTRELYRAQLNNLILWLTKGIAPPHVKPIEVVDGQVVKDEYGNAKGGLRSPYLDIPRQHYFPSAPPPKNAAPGAPTGPVRGMSLIGTQEDLSVDHLKAQFKTRAAYLKEFNAQIDRMVAGRLLLAEDAKGLKADEAKSPPF